MAIDLLRSLVRGRLAAALVLSLSWLASASPGVAGEPVQQAAVCPAGQCPTGEAGQHGTQINWVESADRAAQQAAEQGKLVFLMQISGNFAREEFTWNNASKFRAGALSDPTLGAFIDQHFVAAYQQKGDFEVVRVKDEVQKNGGNVVSYFCTSDMRVVHFVVGPVSAERLFAEAAWVHRVYDEVRYRSLDEPTPDEAEALSRYQTDYVRQQHLAKLGVDGEQIVQQMKERQALQARSTQSAYARSPSYGRTSSKKPAPERWSSLIWNTGGGNETRPHRLLAYDPLPPLAEVDTAVFRQLAGERVNDRDGSIERAMASLKQAEKQGRPVIFAFYREWGGGPDYLRRLYADSSHSKLLRQFVVVQLPLKELPALSARIPNFTLPVVPDTSRAQLVFVDCRMRQISAMSDSARRESVASVLRHAIAKNQVAFAQRLIQEDRTKDAKRVLYAARRSKDRDAAMHAEAVLATLATK